jgi:hypothetical protein
VIGGRLADHTLAFMVPIYNPTRSVYPRVRQINRRSPAILPDLARDRGYGSVPPYPFDRALTALIASPKPGSESGQTSAKQHERTRLRNSGCCAEDWPRRRVNLANKGSRAI